MPRTKRQKTGQVQPLGTQPADSAAKDDDERRLEAILFGVPHEPRVQPEHGGVKELEHMLDADLFFIDGAPTNALVAHDGSTALPESDDDPDEEEHATAEPRTRKQPAWVDPDDANVQVSLTAHARLRKLRDAPSEDTIGGREYERRLRRQYERINPAPDWARKQPPKRRRSASASDADEVDVQDILPDLLTSTGGISGGKNPKTLTQGVVSVDRLRDANQAAPAEGEIKSLQFHPSQNIHVLLTASTDRRLRLFHVDGLTNPHAKTLHIPSLPLTNAVFHPSGSSILLTGRRPFYYTYDLQSGASHRSPRGLWGTTFGPNQDKAMDICAFSPIGDVLAIAGRRGHIHLVDWRSGAAQVVATLKANAAVRSLSWSRGQGPSQLLSLTEDSQVYVWDVGQRRCVKRWQDDGGFGSRVLQGDQRGSYLAIGSNTGLVNVYGSKDALASDAPKPKPLKTLGNLTTNISCLSYNHDSQLLAMASNAKKDQMRLVHLPSLTVFGNWPTSSTPLGQVTAIDFSTGSEYIVVGNNRGRVLLYQLRDYMQQ